MCRVKGLNKLPLNKIKAALKDNPAVNMVSAETLPLMSRACELFIKVVSHPPPFNLTFFYSTLG